MKTTVYTVNEVHGEYFKTLPARSTVNAAELLMGARVEIEASPSEDLDYDDSWHERRERPSGRLASKGVGESVSEELCFTPATELAARIRRRDLSPVEVVDAFLERIEERNGGLNAYVTVLGEEAREAARGAERALGSGEALGPLHGVPVAIKDLFDYKAGVRNTYGLKPMANYVPNRDATYVERLERAGAIVLGKTNTPEFGHRAITDNLLFGPTSTPFAPGKNAGGSSGGSAAAVADGLAPMAQGSDGGGGDPDPRLLLRRLRIQGDLRASRLRYPP